MISFDVKGRQASAYDAYSKVPPEPQFPIYFPQHQLSNTQTGAIPHSHSSIFHRLLSSLHTMDGDQSAKTMEQGANSAMKDDSLASGIHETTKQTVLSPPTPSSPSSSSLLPPSPSTPHHLTPPLTQPQPAAGDKTTGTGTSIFSKDGAVGSMFNADGAIGGTAQKVGGPLDKQGAVGQHFNADGKIGGMVQENLANKS